MCNIQLCLLVHVSASLICPLLEKGLLQYLPQISSPFRMQRLPHALNWRSTWMHPRSFIFYIDSTSTTENLSGVKLLVLAGKNKIKTSSLLFKRAYIFVWNYWLASSNSLQSLVTYVSLIYKRLHLNHELEVKIIKKKTK